MSASGLQSQLMFAQETTYGTRVVPTKGAEFISESLKLEIERMEGRGLRAGRRVLTSSQWQPGKRSAGGDLEMELLNTGTGLLWKHALGATSTVAGTGFSTHTYTPADLQTLSMTMQVGKPDVAGTVRPFDYLGCKIASWEVSCSAGEIAMAKFSILAADESTAQSLASATYPANHVPLTFAKGVLSIAAAGVDVKEATFSVDNGLAGDRYFLRSSALRKQPLENAWRAATGSLVADFESLTAYNRFVNGTEAALSLKFTGADIAGSTPLTPFSFEIVANVRFDGETPAVSGPELLEQPLQFKAVASGAADSTAYNIIRVTSEAAADT